MSAVRATSRRLTQIDSLRGIAAVMVMLYHYVGFAYGADGVTLFFVISGFVILVSLEGKATFGAFAWARFVRLYPVYWSAVGLTSLALLLAGQAEQVSGEKILVNLTMVPLIFRQFAGSVGTPAWYRLEDLDYSYWTLIYELFFYALAGLSALVLRIRRPEFPCLVWLAATMIERLLHPVGLPWDVFGQAATRFSECFVIGVVIHEFYRDRARGLTWLLAIAAVAVSLVDEHGGGSGKFPILVVGAGLLVWLGSIGALRPLMLQPFPFLGRISYALYLVHQTIGDLIEHALAGHGVGGGLNLAIRCLVALGLASALTFFVERRAHQMLIGLFDRAPRARGVV